MSDIIQELSGVIADMEDDKNLLPTRQALYLLLNRAAGAIDSRDREIARLRCIADADGIGVHDAFLEGFAEGYNGTWVEGDPTYAWEKSNARKEM